MCNTKRLFFSLVLFFWGLSKAFPLDTLPTEPGVHFPPGSLAVDLFMQYSCYDSSLSRIPTYEKLAAVELYLQMADQPSIKSSTPGIFIERLEQRNALFQVRNGHLNDLLTSYRAFKNRRHRLHLLCEALGVHWNVHRKKFQRKEGTDECDWALFRQMRRSLYQAFRDFKEQLALAYATELALIHQYLHNPLLFEAVNQLQNLDGTVLPTYVYSRRSLQNHVTQLRHLNGLVVVSQYRGLLSSDTPEIRKAYPRFIGKTNALAVFLEAGCPGALVSHEFGHLYFLYHHWEEYMSFVRKRGPFYQVGGHGLGDPNGIAAELAEDGKMPDLHMSWKYRRTREEQSMDSATIVHGEEE